MRGAFCVISTSLGFAGGLVDPFTGFIRFGYRDYDPTVGRFTAKDPLGDTGGDHYLYDYCVDDPVSRFDFTGLDSVPVKGLFAEPERYAKSTSPIFSPFVLAQAHEPVSPVERDPLYFTKEVTPTKYNNLELAKAHEPIHSADSYLAGYKYRMDQIQPYEKEAIAR